MRSVIRLIAAAAALLACMPACSRKPAEKPAAVEDDVLHYRQERDQMFRSGQNSPLAPELKARFNGLAYYPINPSLRFEVRLNRYPAPKVVRIGTNTGEIRTGLRYGYFEFVVEGKTCSLQVYRLTDDPAVDTASLFIPFKDATSGSETYASGRYIDLRENTSGIYDLDFNRAYNPACAYGEGFSCPVPPEENRLAVPIRAGEKKFPLHQS